MAEDLDVFFQDDLVAVDIVDADDNESRGIYNAPGELIGHDSVISESHSVLVKTSVCAAWELDDRITVDATAYLVKTKIPEDDGKFTRVTLSKAPPPPAAPANLQIIAGDGQAALTWDPAAALNYVVARSDDGGSTYNIIGTPTDESYLDTGLTNGQTYFYKVASSGHAGAGSYCSPQSTTPNIDAPANLALVPGNTQISLSWDPVTGASSYVVSRSDDGGTTYSPIATQSGTSLDDTGLTNDQEYFYKVASIGAGGPGSYCAPQSATPTAASWAPLTWDNQSGSNGFTTFGNGRIKKTGGADENWDTGAWSNITFSSFPRRIRAKVSTGIFTWGFADASNHNLNANGNQFDEKWSIGQYTAIMPDPGANGPLSGFDNFNGFGPLGVNQNQTDYIYLNIAADGTVTVEYQGSTVYTFSINATGKTLIPYVAAFNSNFELTEAAYI